MGNDYLVKVVDVDLVDDSNGVGQFPLAGSLSLSDLLEPTVWKVFSSSIVKSTAEMLFFKKNKLQQSIARIENRQTNTYAQEFGSWGRYLEEVADSANLKGEEGHAFFDNSNIFDIIKDQYPDFFSSRVSLQRLKGLLSEMEHVLQGATVEGVRRALAGKGDKASKAYVSAVQKMSST